MPTPRSHMSCNTMGMSGARQVERWVHLDEHGGDPWILPVWTAVNEAAEAGRCLRLTKALTELGVHTSTRLTLLPRVVRRVAKGVYNLYAAVANRTPKHEFTRDSNGAAFWVDSDVKYELLADLDSLLFELCSACEMMGRLFKELHTLSGKPMPGDNFGTSIRSVLKHAGADPAWFTELDANRNFFIHEGAPYIGVDVSNSRDYDVLIMKENMTNFDEEDKFIRLSQIIEIYQGFTDSKKIVQKHLKKLFA